MSYIPISPFISKSIITFDPSPILAKRLYTPYKSALYIMLAILNLILDCLGFELAVAVYRGLPTGRPLPCVPCVLCVPCVPYVPVWSGDVVWCRFWPVEAWDGLMLKVGNAGKAPASPWFIACCFYLYDLACRCSYSC